MIKLKYVYIFRIFFPLCVIIIIFLGKKRTPYIVHAGPSLVHAPRACTFFLFSARVARQQVDPAAGVSRRPPWASGSLTTNFFLSLELL